MAFPIDAQVVNGHDVRVRQPCEQQGLAPKSPGQLGRPCAACEHLHRDLPIQRRLSCAINGSRAAALHQSLRRMAFQTRRLRRFHGQRRLGVDRLAPVMFVQNGPHEIIG